MTTGDKNKSFVVYDIIVMTEILPKDKIGNKDIWLPNIGNDGKASIKLESYKPTPSAANTGSFDNIKF